MLRLDLHFLVCCCGAFLPHKKKVNDEGGDESEKSFYDLLGVDHKASPEEIRKAYKKRSLEYHPDKIAQRKGGDEEIARRQFQQIKEAYEIIMDPTKRNVYDIMGQEAMSYLMNPSSIEMKVLHDNLAVATTIERLKVVLGITVFFFVILIQPILICLKVDDRSGVFSEASWVVLLTPIWIIDVLAFILLGILIIFLTPLLNSERTPSKIHQSISFIKLTLMVVAQVFLALKFDDTISWSYATLFIPIYLYEFVRFVQAIQIRSQSNKEIGKMVTIAFVEKETGKSYSDMSAEERDEINEKYIIVHTPPVPADMDEKLKALIDEMDVLESPEFQQANKVSQAATGEIYNAIVHVIFLGLLVPNLDSDNINWNWWIVFIPIWISFCCQCTKNCYIVCCTGASPHMMEEQDESNSKDDPENLNDDSEFEDVEMQKIHPPPAEEIEEDNDESLSLDEKKDIEVKLFPKEDIDISQGNSSNKIPLSEVQIDINEFEKNSPILGNDEISKSEESTQNYEEVHESPGGTEAESSAVEATAQAVGSCCSMLFYLTIVCLFVGKLQGGDESFSALWVIFPILFPAGLLCCCFSCAIMSFHGLDSLEAKLGGKDESSNDYNNEEAIPATGEGMNSSLNLASEPNTKTIHEPSIEELSLVDSPPPHIFSDFDDLD